jgi:hypothetical protein
MNRRELETLLVTLESTPVLLARAARELRAEEMTSRPRAGGFSFVENVWHLADLEREGYGARIRRLLSEDEPTLSDFEGDRVARERAYQRKDVHEGLRVFAEQRNANVERLRAAASTDWRRAGFQESVGRITLADVPKMMASHDRSHTLEVRALLEEIRRGIPSEPSRSAVA